MNANKLNKKNENKMTPVLRLIKTDGPNKKTIWMKLKIFFLGSDLSYQDWEHLEKRRVRPQDHNVWRNF